ncbi:sodium-dependent bicarbonate transport family permease [Balneatrix alpica]|uniref:sodium-dependent bicarbonate transport family permease n=1 Tax=Balneatrix alpica TaxID=75684 RepID=UPI0027390031|nr:sodium-dependent bicarbonate transport family permease [Balneatrix alpica]
MPDPVIAVFALGLFAGLIRSDLKVPQGTYDTLTILLLFALGMKGGLAIREQGLLDVLPQALTIALLGALIPLVLFPVLRKLVRLNSADSAAMAAHYGSVSVGTFAVGMAYLEHRLISYEPQLTLFVVMLEMPAIGVAILLSRMGGANQGTRWGQILHEVFASRGMVLLGGGLLIGSLYGKDGLGTIAPLFMQLFHGLLALFLLEMGLCAANFLRHWERSNSRVLIFALCAPPLLAISAIPVANLMGLSEGGSVLLMTLFASASYIAAPAAMRQAVPEANTGMAISAALAITFPFNTLIGIGIYHQVWQWLG